MQPTPIFLPGESHGWRSLVGYSPRGCKETQLSDFTFFFSFSEYSFELPFFGTFNITVIQVHAPTTNTEEAEAKWFYEDLQDLLGLTCQKDVLFIIGGWNEKVGSQEIPGVTGKFGLGIQNEAGNTPVIANSLFQ